MLLAFLVHAVHADDHFPDLGDPVVLSETFERALDWKSIRKRGSKSEELIYAHNGKAPLTGWVSRLHKNGHRESLRHYTAGKEDGPFLAWWSNANKLLCEGHYKNGQKHGRWRLWYENGRMDSERHYRNGISTGVWSGWHKNGQKKWQHQFNMEGKMAGLSTGWHENGQKSDECYYEDGKQEGRRTEWDKDGRKTTETHYKAGERHGLSTRWDKDGSKLYETNYKDGKLHGPMILFSKKGDKLSEWLYENGQKVKP